MRSFTVHPASLTLGLVLAGVCFISLAQTIVTTPLRVEYLAHPRDMVRIHEGVPFTVPSGKILVLTALGTDQAGGSFDAATLTIDGVQEARVSAWVNSSVLPCSIVRLPPGRSVAAGSTVVVDSSNPSLAARAWGYLAEAGTTAPGSTTTLRLQYQPHPRDLVQVTEGAPYTIPSGKLFVLTALGSTGATPSTGSEHSFRINGQAELIAQDPGSYTLPPMADVPEGLAVAEGSTVDVVLAGGPSSPGRAWGYLVNQ